MIKSIFFFTILLFLSTGCSRYDAKKPDTGENRRGFARVTGINPDSDVTKIYFYADEMGPDPLYCFAFQTSQKTVQNILEKFQLKESENTEWQEPFPVPDDLFWWDAGERKNSRFYSARQEQTETVYYFWHNPDNAKCQFMMVCF